MCKLGQNSFQHNFGSVLCKCKAERSSDCALSITMACARDLRMGVPYAHDIPDRSSTRTRLLAALNNVNKRRCIKVWRTGRRPPLRLWGRSSRCGHERATPASLWCAAKGTGANNRREHKGREGDRWKRGLSALEQHHTGATLGCTPCHPWRLCHPPRLF